MKSSNVIGARGDFITSPEISQVFGEVNAQPDDMDDSDNELSVTLIASRSLVPFSVVVLRAFSRHSLGGTWAWSRNAHA